MTAKVCIIIPFYQKKEGILRKAVLSALNQKRYDDFMILIVDDGSPVSARRELKDLPPEAWEKIQIIEQENTGVGAARNKGLDNVPRQTQFVAFLDSDDEWTEGHLANAVQTLERGFDFYFSDFYQIEQTISAFDRAKRIDIRQHPIVAGMESVHEYQGDMLDQIIRGNVIGTPVVAYNYSKLGHIRFREEFKHAGEDYLFWSDIAVHTKAIAFSSECECRCGSGVNIYAGSSWGTDKYLRIRIDEAKYRRIMLDQYPINPAQRHLIEAHIVEIRTSFARGLFSHAIRGRGRVNFSLIREYMGADRGFITALPVLALKIAVEKVLRRGP